jgi:hypothetical protein
VTPRSSATSARSTAAAFAACTSPSSVSGLADGAHTYDVRATNSAGIPGPATTKTWTVDTTPPVAPSVTGAPVGTVATDAATLTLGGEAGATFRCSVDGGSFVTCASPLVLTGLAVGAHTMQLRMVNAAGTAGAARSITWEVKAPVVAPATPTATTTPKTPAATTPAAPAATPPATTITPAACVSRRSVSVHWKLPAGAKAKGFKVLVDGKVVKRLSAKARAFTLALNGRPAAAVKVQVTAVGAD